MEFPGTTCLAVLLVLSLTACSETMAFDPFDLPAAHIFKVGADGLVHEIDAMVFTAPYDSLTGWE